MALNRSLFIGLDGSGKTSVVNLLALRHAPARQLVVGPPPSTDPEKVRHDAT
jgi:thymidylate kinase